MRHIWHNGEIKPESEAKVSVYDSAMLFGDTVFEMTRSFNKVHFKLNEHIERLFHSMSYLNIGINPEWADIKFFQRICYQLSELNDKEFQQDDEHRLMINVSRGALGIYKDVEGVVNGTNIMITDFPLRWTVNGFGKYYDYGINMVIVNQRALSHSQIEPKIKHRSRLYLQMANIQASRFKGDNWALMLDEDGYIAEGTGDNIFMAKNGVIYTPEGRNILRGISRQFIFDLCDKYGYKYCEKNIEPYDLYNADEVFITGTPFCILPVTKIDGKEINHGIIGDYTLQLLKIWGNEVGIDIRKQIKNWDLQNNNTEGVSPYIFK
jgi:branched-chain amino acid aminotransferase